MTVRNTSAAVKVSERASSFSRLENGIAPALEKFMESVKLEPLTVMYPDVLVEE